MISNLPDAASWRDHNVSGWLPGEGSRGFYWPMPSALVRTSNAAVDCIRLTAELPAAERFGDVGLPELPGAGACIRVKRARLGRGVGLRRPGLDRRSRREPPSDGDRCGCGVDPRRGIGWLW